MCKIIEKMNLARFVLPSSGMASTNSTENHEQKSFEDMVCSAKLTEGIHDQIIVLLLLNSFLAFTAVLGNTLILVALHKETSLHAPSKLLLRSLATVDLCVGIIVQPLYVTYLYFVNERREFFICRHAFAVAHVTGYSFCSVSLLILTAISVDRLLALLLGLKYRQVVTFKRMCVTVTLSWVVSTIGSTLYLRNHRITLWYGYSNVSLCLATSLFCYKKIFITLRNNQVQAQGNVNQGQQFH